MPSRPCVKFPGADDLRTVARGLRSAGVSRLRRPGNTVHYTLGDKRGKDTLNKLNDGSFVGLSEIIATPVFYKDRVYVAIGRDPDHGRGRGALVCLDAGQTGDCTRTAKLWTYQGLDRSLSTVSIAEGLLYIADVAGRLHCLDAETGQLHWVYESKGTRSPRPSWPMERSTWPTKSTWTCWRRARPCDF